MAEAAPFLDRLAKVSVGVWRPAHPIRAGARLWLGSMPPPHEFSSNIWSQIAALAKRQDGEKVLLVHGDALTELTSLPLLPSPGSYFMIHLASYGVLMYPHYT